MQAPTSKRDPLRVVLLDSIEEWGGGEKWCVQTAAALSRRGHRVIIASRAGSALAERAHAASLPLWTGARGPLGWGPGSSLRLARFLRAERVEAVIANVGRDVRMGAIACRLSGARLLQRRGLLRPIKRTRINRWLYRHEVERVIVNSTAIRDRMIASAGFVDSARFVLIPNGIDTGQPSAGDGARLRAELGIDGAPLVASVGRLAPMKGHASLLAAWSGVEQAIPAARLVIVGDGPLRSSLEAEASRLGLTANIQFLGFRRELDDVYAAMDLFVLPSVRDEGASNALLEAMWHGRPAVVTACGGSAEVVAEGEAGLVVPIDDPVALGGAIRALLGDTDARGRMGEAARERIERHYSLARVTDLLERLLVDLRAEPV